MVLVPLRQGGPGIDRLQAHEPHQTKDPLGIDRMPLGSEPGGHPAVSIDRGSGELRVDQAHEHLGEEIQLPGLVIPAGATETQEIALTLQTDVRMANIHKRPLLIQAMWHFFFSQSNSTLSWPIS